uniref:Heterodimeric efflux ABC transporter, permease/ATP-binding subunit 1 n=1 Tax=uncultured Nocardioidaceae bacterium TaxID=253824 RepID=A0A6J4MG45_9ACTN|nr:MAG: Heterodimeric efflux ABC transporter, permease/ATP-binding subunit 1 [uncultured Nocardioidaceae bacterium]
MRNLPLADPGTPDTGSSTRYLVWITRVQPWTVAGAVAAGIVWMVAQALMPAVVGKAIDAGVAARDGEQLRLWAFALLGVGLTQAVAGVVRHRFSVVLWLDAAYRSVQLIGRASARIGAGLPKRVATGEVVSVGANDMAHIGNSVDALGRAVGSLVAFVVVSFILLSTSVTLGLTVLIGLPLLLLAIGPLLRPLQQRNMAAREMQGELNSLASDIVVGLRVLRGIGGEDVFHGRYVAESQRVRAAGVRVARLQSLLDALQVLLPGAFVVVVVWLGARLAVQGVISPGELVAFYGYAAFLVIPLRTATEFVNKVIRGRVAASRLLAILALQPEFAEPTVPAAEPPGSRLVDEESGFVATPGRLTAVVSEDQVATARVADRLGKFRPGRVTFDGVPLAELPTPVVRRRVLVSDTTSTLFSGILRDELDVRGQGDEAHLMAALTTASAEDVMEALPDGLDSEVEEKGRSFSGGQRQRLALARALVADPDVLVLDEPTSAVDAHTEARIAARLREARAGRTTVVMTSSPLLLDQVDEVAFLVGGRVVAQGGHHDLLESVPGYRRTVMRGEDD